MGMCGYHLRCLNYGNNCLDCGHQHEGNKKDYLHDALNLWPKGKEAVYVDVGEVAEQFLIS